MTNLKANTARAALIALIAASPMAAFAAGPQSGSPEQSVAEDPDEYAAPRATYSSSSSDVELYDSFDKADVVDSVNGSIHEDDAKRDD